MSTQHLTRRSEKGQVLVIVAVGMVAMVAMVGLVIDGGYSWGKQRNTQNGADAVAKAATVVVQHHLAGVDTPTDGDVGCVVEAAADANGVSVESVEYTDFEGKLFDPTVVVGACQPGGGAAIPNGAQGARATASLTFDPFVMQVVGFSDLKAVADATAVVGVPVGIPGGALPVTFPKTLSICDQSNAQWTIGRDDEDGNWEPYEIVDERDADQDNLAIIPLCDTGPGSVGWLDFQCGQNLEQSVSDPCRKYIPIPSWIGTQTGNVNALDDELNSWTGPNVGVAEPEDAVLSLPIHDNTCFSQPANGNDPCPQGDWSGSGDNTNYHVPFWVGFKIDSAHTTGGNVECRQEPGAPLLVNPSPPGKVGCIKGWFVDRYDEPGPIGLAQINPGDAVTMAVLLID